MVLLSKNKDNNINERHYTHLNKCYICKVERKTVENKRDNFTCYNDDKHSFLY